MKTRIRPRQSPTGWCFDVEYKQRWWMPWIMWGTSSTRGGALMTSDQLKSGAIGPTR